MEQVLLGTGPHVAYKLFFPNPELDNIFRKINGIYLAPHNILGTRVETLLNVFVYFTIMGGFLKKISYTV